MAATARVTVLMEPEQKTRLTDLARAADMSVGEFMRRKALQTDDELAALLALVEQSTAAANAALDKALAAIERREAEAGGRHAEIVAATRGEFTPRDGRALAEALGLVETEGRA